MENVKNTCALEISSNSIKFAVGYTLNGVPCLVYYKERPIRGLVKNGVITSPDKLVAALSEFTSIEDESLNVKISANNVAIVIPAIGFEVYQIDKATNVVANDNVIAPIDVQNVISLVSKTQTNNSNVIVDIVPDYFVAGKKGYSNPPLGVKSDSITIRAKIHTLPQYLVSSYEKAVQDAGFRINRKCVSSFCASQMIGAAKGYPETYIYVDLGGDLTTISFIGKGDPYASKFIKVGGNTLSEDIAKELNISSDLAEELKVKHGYDEAEHLFELPLFQGKDLNGVDCVISQKDLNMAIKAHFDSFNKLLSSAIDMVSKQNLSSNAEMVPLIIGGGASKLNGIAKLLTPIIGSRALYAFIPPVIGARSPGAIDVLGLIVAEGEYKGAFEENYRGVSTLSREDN